MNQMMPIAVDMTAIGQEIYDLAADIFPICRSITGNGVRQTLDLIGRDVPMQVHEVRSGTRVFDWTVPLEWNVEEAFVENASGNRVVDMRNSNLHVLGYSTPIRATLSLADLKTHIFTLPDQPDLIPYRTSYYQEQWGFCMAHNALLALPEGQYTAVIDSRLETGSLTYGEYFKAGDSDEEVLLSTHICHPSLANDNCSGMAMLTHLAKALANRRTRYGYRFLFIPGTIGAIAWLARNEANIDRIKHGLVVTGVGDSGGPTYKKSRLGNAFIDRAMGHVLYHAAPAHKLVDFFPYGYDERQFCSPGFNMPVGLFQRSQFGTFPQYHTSADNLDFIRPEYLAHSYGAISAAIEIIEHDHRPLSLNMKCEPQLGRRGLYASVGGDKDGPARSMAMLWVMNLADGEHSLLDIAERAGVPFRVVLEAANALRASGLLEARDGSA
jgi:aminopeptidase-like protein